MKEFPSASGRHIAVDNLSVQFEPDKMVALLGPSGSGEWLRPWPRCHRKQGCSRRCALAGKTTLLRMIAGLESTSSGTIMFDGEADCAALLQPVPLQQA